MSVTAAAAAAALPIADPAPSAAALNKRKRKREKEKANKKTKAEVEENKQAKDTAGEDVVMDDAPAAPGTSDEKPTTTTTTTAQDLASKGPKRPRGGKKVAKKKAALAAAAAAAGGDGTEKPATVGASKAKGGEPKKPLVETLDRDMAMMEPRLAADYFVQRLKRFDKDLSSVEVEDKRIPESAYLDTTSFTAERYLSELPKFLETFHSLTPHPEIPLTSSSATPGTPHTLILTSSAIRATHVIRALRTLQTSKDIVIAKLFAKHIKLSDSIALCNSTRINIGVGTPARMLELMREGALKLDGCVRLVLDMSAVNEKKQGLLDVRETQKAVVEFVNEPGVKERLSDGEMRVLVF